MYVYYTKDKGKKDSEKLVLKLLSYYCDSCMGPAYECACCRGCGISDSEHMPRIKRSENGKPYFEGPNMPEFSISHTGDIWLMAIAPFKVGVDIELARDDDKRRKIAKRYFSESEKKLMFGDCETGLVFARAWTRKEAYVKYYGSQLMENLAKDVSCDRLIGETGEELFFSELRLGDYVISVLKERDEPVELKEFRI